MQSVFQSSNVLLLNQYSISNHLADLDGRSRRSNYVIMKLLYPDVFQKNKKNFPMLSFDIHHFQISKIQNYAFYNDFYSFDSYISQYKAREIKFLVLRIF